MGSKTGGSEYRVGLVGYRRGRMLAEAWQGVEGARLVAVADLLPERREQARQRIVAQPVGAKQVRQTWRRVDACKIRMRRIDAVDERADERCQHDRDNKSQANQRSSAARQTPKKARRMPLIAHSILDSF